MKNEIVMIPIGDLAHHPENPRADLGDLTELTESIRANGILQNLTVVPDPQTCKYLVVIGNRRFEAAKAAGMVEVPCAVAADMDHKTQVATMLMENMQRQDLTPYEQAQGFQLMMDLGFKEKEIGEKTGFSTKTVKDRLKLTKLNKKEFTKAIDRGANLIDLIEVTKLESKSAQNHVLEAAGTENFRQRMQSALKDQEFEKNKKRLLPVLEELGLKEIPQNERYNAKWEHEWNEDFDMNGSEDELRKKVKKVTKKNPDVPWVYEMNNYRTAGSISFMHGKPKAAGMTDEERSLRKEAIARGKHLRHVQSFWAQAYELRKDFVKHYTVANGQSTTTMGKIIVRCALDGKTDWNGKIKENHKWDDAYLRDMLDLPEKPVEAPGQEEVKNSWDKKYLSIWKQAEDKGIPTVRAMLAWAMAGGIYWPDGPEDGLYDGYDGKYQKHSNRANYIEERYDLLMECGYHLSDLERQLLDGTHECYKTEGQ